MPPRFHLRQIGYAATLWLMANATVMATPASKPRPALAPLNSAIASSAPAGHAGTGDADIDVILTDINRYAQRYPDAFVDEMARYYAAPRELIDALMRTEHWAAGDIYYACALAQIVGQPCRAVADHWRRDHDQGWTAVALQFGNVSDAAAFARIRQGLNATYRRWSRPLPPTP